VQACLVRDGGVAGAWHLAGAGATAAGLGVAQPPALETLTPAVAAAGGGGAAVELRGVGLHEPDCVLLARASGGHVPIQALAQQTHVCRLSRVWSMASVSAWLPPVGHLQ